MHHSESHRCHLVIQHLGTLAMVLLLAAIAAAGSPLRARPNQQNSPQSSADAEAKTSGTTVNNQTNLQINTLTFTSFGPGINCPTPNITAGLFVVQGSGRSTAGPSGDGQSSTNFGGLVQLNLPIGGTDARICSELGKARVKVLEAQTETVSTDIAQLRSDIQWAITTRCVEVLQVAQLSNQFGSFCQGVSLVRTPPTSAATVLQRFEP